MAGVVRVLVSGDRRWRVEIRDDGTCRVYEDGFLRAMVGRGGLERRLATLGVSLGDLVED